MYAVPVESEIKLLVETVQSSSLQILEQQELIETLTGERDVARLRVGQLELTIIGLEEQRLRLADELLTARRQRRLSRRDEFVKAAIAGGYSDPKRIIEVVDQVLVALGD